MGSIALFVFAALLWLITDGNGFLGIIFLLLCLVLSVKVYGECRAFLM